MKLLTENPASIYLFLNQDPKSEDINTFQNLANILKFASYLFAHKTFRK